MRTRSVIAVCLCFSAAVESARGDGGTLRYSARHGDWHVTVFTSPTPLRAGPADVSVLVQEVQAGKSRPKARPDVPVWVRAYPEGEPGLAVEAEATAELATNKLLRAAHLGLDRPGAWVIEVAGDEGGPSRVAFEAEVDEPLPAWLDLAPWVGWPAAAVGFFAVHRALVRRRTAQADVH